MNYRSLIVVLAVACVMLLGVGAAWAQDVPVQATEAMTNTATIATEPTPGIPSAATIADQVVEGLAGKQTVLFAWYPDNWGQGLLYFVLGLAGALVTVYLFLGEMLPSMGGQVEYERIRLALERYVERREEMLKLRNDAVQGRAEREYDLVALNELSDDLHEMAELLEKRLRSERWRLFALGFPIYLVLGGFFAAGLATNFMEAIIIGFGWTLIADRLGMERQNAQLQVIREKRVNELQNTIKELEADRGQKADMLSKSSERMEQLSAVLATYTGRLEEIQTIARGLLGQLDTELNKLDKRAEELKDETLRSVADDLEQQISTLLDKILGS